jgi:uncharacterized membrane protein
LRTNAVKALAQVRAGAMPLGNESGMSAAEREELIAWLAAQ